MSKSVNNNTVFFLVAVLVAGIISISFQSFIDTEATGDKRDHHNKHKYYKSNDPSVIVKKITCNNLNVNINGLRMDISPDDIASELSTQAQTDNDNNNEDISANSIGPGEGNNLYTDKNDFEGFIYICIDNINAQDSSAPPPPVPPTDETTGDETTGDETTGDETTSDETTSDETTSDETTSDETTSDETTGDETTGDETTSDETTSDETTSDETTSDETTSDETTTTDEEEQQGSEAESKDTISGETPYIQIPPTTDETPSTETLTEGTPYPQTSTPATEPPENCDDCSLSTTDDGVVQLETLKKLRNYLATVSGNSKP